MKRVLETTEAEAWRRAALLARVGEPGRLVRLLEAAEAVEPAEMEAVRRALGPRGLVPWIPPGAGESGRAAPVLLVRGSPPPPRAVAIVGARASDPYGLACAARVARDAVALGAAVVSGGAEGCDAAAHRAAIDAGGRTIVVLGGGHDRPYPKAHRPLFEEAVSGGGAVVSPFWPEVPPGRHRFLLRNRVIAALAQVVVVARAGQRSGALSTARAALKLGRPLLAVPGDVGLGLSQGAHGLLSAGAQALTGSGDLAAALGDRGRVAPPPWPVMHRRADDPWQGGEEVSAAGPARPLSAAQTSILEALGSGSALDLDALQVQTSLGTGALLASLSDLEVGALVEQGPGQRYRLRPGGTAVRSVSTESKNRSPPRQAQADSNR